MKTEKKKYLDEKFKIGQQTGHKADPAQVSQDIRHAKNESGFEDSLSTSSLHHNKSSHIFRGRHQS